MHFLASLAVALGLVVGAAPAAAAPTLEILTDNITNCGYVKFKYGGGTPPYKFNAVTAYFPTQALIIVDKQGEGGWKCIFPASNGPADNTTSISFFLEDATSALSPATRLYDVGANTGPACPPHKDPPFMWIWSPRMADDPGTSIPECKQLILSTRMFGNVNATIHFPLSVTVVVPGGDVWRVNGIPETPELTIPFAVRAGARALLLIRDARNREGGSSNLLTATPGSSGCGQLHAVVAPAAAALAVSVPAIAGIAVGAVGALTLFLLALWGFLRWRREAPPAYTRTAVFTIDGTPPSSPASLFTSESATPTRYDPTPFVTQASAPSNNPPAFPAAPSTTAESSSVMSKAMSRYSAPPPGIGTVASHMSMGSMSLAASSDGPDMIDMNPLYNILDDAGPVPTPVGTPPAPTAPALIDMPPTYNQAWARPEGSAGSPVPTAPQE